MAKMHVTPLSEVVDEVFGVKGTPQTRCNGEAVKGRVGRLLL
jgi:hypothetical protein